MVDSYGAGAVSSRFPEVTGPAPRWQGAIWGGCDKEFWKETISILFALLRCPGMITLNIPKELCSPITVGFIEGKGMILVIATSKNGSAAKSWGSDKLYD